MTLSPFAIPPLLCPQRKVMKAETTIKIYIGGEAQIAKGVDPPLRRTGRGRRRKNAIFFLRLGIRPEHTKFRRRFLRSGVLSLDQRDQKAESQELEEELELEFPKSNNVYGDFWPQPNEPNRVNGRIRSRVGRYEIIETYQPFVPKRPLLQDLYAK